MIRGQALTDEVTLVNDEDTGDEDVFGNPETADLPGVTVPAFVSPLDATEDEINRDVRLNRYAVIVETGRPVDGLSELVWQGRRYRVIGEPRVYSSHRGAHHLEFEIRAEVG